MQQSATLYRRYVPCASVRYFELRQFSRLYGLARQEVTRVDTGICRALGVDVLRSHGYY